MCVQVGMYLLPQMATEQINQCEKTVIRGRPQFTYLEAVHKSSHTV